MSLISQGSKGTPGLLVGRVNGKRVAIIAILASDHKGPEATQQAVE